MRRRTFLATGGTALVALAGCTSGGSGDGEGGPTDSMGTNSMGTESDGMGDGTGTTQSGSNSLANAEIAANLDSQPREGPDPMAGESVVVEVTDPSCPTCRSFHNQAFPKIKSELVDTGKTAFVVRNVDWVYSWAPQASAALEAVHDRNSESYWDLLAFYFDSQSDLSSQTVLSATESHLEDATVDGAAVVEAVEAGEYDAAVSADVSAARDAGVQAQPYFFLFKNGQLVTDFYGPQSYSVFRSTLGY